MIEPRWWAARAYGHESTPVLALGHGPGKARYALFLAMRDAGYWRGSNRFGEFLVECSTRPATEAEITEAKRLGRIAGVLF